MSRKLRCCDKCNNPNIRKLGKGKAWCRYCGEVKVKLLERGEVKV